MKSTKLYALVGETTGWIGNERNGRTWGGAVTVFGVGTTPEAAREDSKQWGFDGTGEIVEITEEEAAAIAEGNPELNR